MKKFIFYTIKSVQDYCLTFSWRFNAGFSSLTIMTSIHRLSKLCLNSWHQSLALSFMLGAILMTGYTANAQINIQGVAPVSSPINGSGVDGNLDAHIPNDPLLSNGFSPGDLFDRGYYNNGTPDPAHTINHGLINPSSGAVLWPPTVPASVPSTYQLKDHYGGDGLGGDLTIFVGTNKVNDNPNTYKWGPGSSANKGEIQNSGVHFSFGDPVLFPASGVVLPAPGIPGIPEGKSTDLWCLFAGDRQTTNGSAFIAFEFLQKTMSMTNVKLGPVNTLTGVQPITGFQDPALPGGFISEGTQGGRTVGDKLVTIEFRQGGAAAIVFIHEWNIKLDNKGNPVFSGGILQYEYTPFTIVPNTVFCTNNTVPSPVPFDVFGTDPGTYAVNQYAEGAVNLTAIFGSSCTVISTVFIVTRSSGSSSSSELFDFPGAPIQLNLSLSPNVNDLTDVTKCSTDTPYVLPAITGTNLTGNEGYWTGSGGTGTELAVGASITSTQTIYIYDATGTTPNCTDEESFTVTVNAISPGVIAGSQTLCTPFNPAAFTSTTAAIGDGVITYQWQISTTGCAGTFTNITDATSATYDAPAVSVITNFRRVATSTLNNVACSANSNCLTVTPNYVTSGVIAGNQTLCTPFNPAAFTSTTDGSGSAAIVTYQWQIGTTAGCDLGFSDIAGATSATYDAPALTAVAVT
ncbi:hypothetical protein ACM55K_17375, partial [Flavobacterium sp. LT1R49]|uniref:hypothetical protein n=1 Tax=Flavobacterium arabinosi TaxID=3398737 RepID=UPI003A8436A1